MAISSTGVLTLAKAHELIQQECGGIKAQTAQIRAQSLTGNLSALLIVVYAGYMRSSKLRMVAAITAVGAARLAAYVQSQINDGSDIVADFAAMTVALDATLLWISSNLPKDGSGFLLERTIDATGATVDRVFTSAQLVGFRAHLDALSVTII